jgi:hypothetical protein
VSKKVTLKVGTLLIDHQDGGYGMTIYPSYKEAEAAKRERCKEKAEYSKTASAEDWFDDDYETGYLDEGTIELNVDDNGKITLAKELYFHAGQ